MTSIVTPGNLVGIVGPNGCGKSNVIDAVRWVLGESRASELRGESMQDVIFNGSGQRQRAGRASVELLFDNPTGRIGGQWASFTEISIKRVLSRDGQSTYFINQQPVRRRDVFDAFMGTGVGARGYAIIGQGTINRFIEAKPEELRVYLEEVAGVSRYKARRRETENRLRDTRENLQRVDDIYHELQQQLTHLQAQAATAKQYQALQEALRLAQHCLWWVQQRQAREKQQQVQRQVESAQQALAQQLEQQQTLAREVDRKQRAHYGLSDAVHNKQGELLTAGARVSQLETELKHVQKSRDTLQQRRQQLAEQKLQWQEQIVHYEEKLAEAQEEDETLVESLEALEARQEDVRYDEAVAHDKWQQQLGSLGQQQQRLNDAQRDLALAQQAYAQTQRQRQSLANRHQELQQERDAISVPELAALDAARASLQAAQQRQSDAQAQQAERQQQIRTLQQESKALADQVQAAQRHHSEQHAQQQALQALQDEVANPQQQQQWLARHGWQDHLPLWQILTVAPEWVAAVQAVLDRKLLALPVAELPPLARLKAPPAGRIGLVCPAALADDARPSGQGNPARQHTLASKVTAPDADLQGMVDTWLSGALLANDLAAAWAQRHQLLPGQYYVVAQGHQVDRYGIHFYAPEAPHDQLLNRQQDLVALRESAQTAQAALANLQSQAGEVEATLESLTAAAHEGQQALATMAADVHRLDLAASMLAQKRAEAQRQTESLAGRAQALTTEQAQLTAQQEKQAAAVARVSKMVEEHSQQLATQRQAVDAAQQARHELGQAARVAEQRYQAVRYQQTALHERRNEWRRSLQLAHEQKQQAEQTLTSIQGELFEIDEASLQASLQAAVDARRQKEQALGAAREQLAEAEAALRKAKEDQLARTQAVEPLRDNIAKLQLQEQEARLTREQFGNQLQQAEVDEAAITKHLAGAPAQWQQVRWLQAECKRLRQAIDGLGAVNLAALDEVKQHEAREAFLRTQSEDLTQAIATLEDAIRNIDRETRNLLQQTFDAVNQHFGELFPQLFGGGQARLVMTGEEILDAGVQVTAQPPGKRNTTIHLLSGGEKALTAIALVFALFTLNPAPFCLLDEVDAPLDDANTGRFVQLVTTMSEHTQFVFVSHNKITMQMAKQLIGVTMQEQGVSRVVAVDIESALQMAEPV